MDARGRGARAGARAARGGRSRDGRRRRPLAGRRGRGRGVRARRPRARRLRATSPLHARRGGAGVARAPPARPQPSLPPRPAASGALSHPARDVLEALDQRGASFFGDLVNATGLLRTEVEKGLGELVAWGLVTSDSFAGLRALLVPSDRRRPIGGFRRRGRIAPFGVETAGRWSRVPAAAPPSGEAVAG